MTPAKRVKRQRSKPILGWLQKKLGGASRAPRDSVRAAGERPRANTLQVEIPTRQSESNRVVLNEDDESNLGRSTPPRSSRSSTWSPANREADDDASIRPLPPTSPPSPAPSRSSSSYLSDPRTFRSQTASTKPTTLMSIDLTNGMAHIAQAPPTPTTVFSIPRISTSGNGTGGPTATSISFSALPPTSPATRSESRSETQPSSSASDAVVQAPLHTSHHPRYNPRPSSPPQDDASVLTLASSAFAFPGGRMGGWIGDSQSQFALDSSSQQGGDLETDEAQIVEDASVRALRPRSSRRGSWESEASGWSARVAMVRERSLKTSSWKAGPQTDGDASTEITGEENEESKGIHGPSPLAANGFTNADTIAVAAKDEGTTPPAKEPLQKKFLELPSDAPKDVSQVLELDYTKVKGALVPPADSAGSEEDLAQKAPLKESIVQEPGVRTLSGEGVGKDPS